LKSINDYFMKKIENTQFSSEKNFKAKSFNIRATEPPLSI